MTVVNGEIIIPIFMFVMMCIVIAIGVISSIGMLFFDPREKMARDAWKRTVEEASKPKQPTPPSVAPDGFMWVLVATKN